MATLRNKIVEVHSAAKVIVQHFGHTKKFAKHIVAFVIKPMKQFTDVDLAEFLGKDQIGKILGYRKGPHISTFSKVRERSDPRILIELNNWIIHNRVKGKQLRLIGQDGTDVPAYSKKDRNATKGVRTIPKKRQYDEEKVEFFFGYKVHMIAELEHEIPLGITIEPANKHEKTMFRKLFQFVNNSFRFGIDPKFLADSALDATDVREELRRNNITPAIAINGRKWRRSERPKDPEYGKRWALERIFSRLKEVFGLGRNRLIGIKKVTIHVYSCLIAYLIKYTM